MKKSFKLNLKEIKIAIRQRVIDVAVAKPGLVTALGITEAQVDEMLEGCKV